MMLMGAKLHWQPSEIRRLPTAEFLFVEAELMRVLGGGK